MYYWTSMTGKNEHEPSWRPFEPSKEEVLRAEGEIFFSQAEMSRLALLVPCIYVYTGIEGPRETKMLYPKISGLIFSGDE